MIKYKVRSIGWSESGDSPSYDVVPNGITIWSDMSQEKWNKKLLAIVALYVEYEKAYKQDGAYCMHHHLLGGNIEQVKEGRIRMIADDDRLSIVWTIGFSGNNESKLDCETAMVNEQGVIIPEIVTVPSGRFCSLNNYTEMLIIDACDWDGRKGFSECVHEIWDNKRASQILILARSKDNGNILYEQLANKMLPGTVNIDAT